MRKIKLVTYKPLCSNIFGINAIKSFSLNPYIDSSCRREPDLELSNPSISGLCRKNKFAPQLKIDDIIIYLTLPAKYKAAQKYLNQDTYNLTAILKVIHVFPNHLSASKWYENNYQPIPSNCMIEGNYPVDFNRTGSNYDSQKKMKDYFSLSPLEKTKEARKQLIIWDQEYNSRAHQYPSFVITEYLYDQINNPIPIHKNQLKNVFNGSIPGTQNPKNLSEEEFYRLIDFITTANKSHRCATQFEKYSST